MLTSCSLVKIESAQEPLGIRELNTRLLTQGFAQTAMDRVEFAADSIATLSSDNKDVQLNTLRWKIKTSEELGSVSFQTEPKIALMDTWSYFLEVRNALENPALEVVFGPHKHIAKQAIDQNIEDIESIARNVLEPKEFDKIKGFVQDYADNASLLTQREFKHQSIRES
ncbi:MAG: hypothetical protein HRU26_02290, partial [Psychroserpens sp.]|nr:hypothetical protein [Psychroserpens sp.]